MPLDITCTVIPEDPQDGFDRRGDVLDALRQFEARLDAIGVPFSVQVRDIKPGTIVHRTLSAGRRLRVVRCAAE